jgi:hypothetical protein
MLDCAWSVGAGGMMAVETDLWDSARAHAKVVETKGVFRVERWSWTISAPKTTS